MIRRYFWLRKRGFSRPSAVLSVTPEWVLVILLLVITAVAASRVGQMLADWEPWR